LPVSTDIRVAFKCKMLLNANSISVQSPVKNN